jgi:hypothetical protein
MQTIAGASVSRSGAETRAAALARYFELRCDGSENAPVRATVGRATGRGDKHLSTTLSRVLRGQAGIVSGVTFS